jgi:hypothetical protein
MPRQLRIQYPAAICHVLNRGDRREPIFHGDADRQHFLENGRRLRAFEAGARQAAQAGPKAPRVSGGPSVWAGIAASGAGPRGAEPLRSGAAGNG